MKLSDLITLASIIPNRNFGDADIGGIRSDSRFVQAGDLYVCMPGTTTDSHKFIADAAQSGAAGVVVHNSSGFDTAVKLGLPAAWIEDRNFEFADGIAAICNAFFDHPTQKLRLIAVTGTNGKSTTAWLVRDLMSQIGWRSGYLGTLGFQLDRRDGTRLERSLPNTTPFAVDLYNLIDEAVREGVEALAIEISSHALAQHRCEGFEFDAGIFTNLTPDHLDFHVSMEEYRAAKRRLFEEFPQNSAKSFTSVMNVDDGTGQQWANELSGRIIRFSSTQNVEVRACNVHVALDRINMEIAFGDSPAYRVVAPLGGSYNVENLVAAAAGLFAVGFSPVEIADAMPFVHPVPGRFEPVPNPSGIGIIIDYAHTPDAIEKLLDAARPLSTGRLIIVFGCGGDRDRTKRPLMAHAASTKADVVVLTSDNPRTEDPDAIMDEIEVGILPGIEFHRVINRPEAIRLAVQLAKPGDTVLIAGKGHETYQIIGREKVHMDDRELARSALSFRNE